MSTKFVLVCLFYLFGFFQLPEKPIAVIDFVKIKNNRRDEAIYFYRHNWLVYREIAQKRNQILSYEILQTRPDSSMDCDLILTTIYKDSAQWKAGETNFSSIIKEQRPNGPELLNALKPADFRQLIATKVAESLISNKKAFP